MPILKVIKASNNKIIKNSFKLKKLKYKLYKFG